jgi:predicted RNase H-like HicB family nuclease
MESGETAYHAYFPALKGCHTWDRTYDEALANVREAVELYVEDLRDSGSRIPIDLGLGGLWPTRWLPFSENARQSPHL